MEIDNYTLIKSLMNFTSEDDFYFIQILKRKKENPDISSNHNNNRRSIRTYYVRSLDYFDSIIKEIKDLCIATNSRAYIHLTKRSFRKVAFLALENMSKQLRLGTFNNVYKSYNTACGGLENRNGEKYWVLDIDTKEKFIINQYLDIIFSINPDVFKTIIPTKNGVHLITQGFNTKEFTDKCEIWSLEKIDIHKNNPTLLYFKESNS